ncbi:KpsF/GutQ family sugar-phosphate isomerase [Neolewinella lacunae]|uniref:KpsF/GutQ family sugar-phosphate isomerase n=1 Tax=Neolewinella lacunae TaxID=1517758 RepID=A0A923PRZ3_9BACT|nr:KpsF/GutQ family sugar-phosphate isomerase [Neolewinella lacunae]MBC6996409.1 KpsF/GutQ family sugar-phosphate isomerase [Neolewinella lacunae]MDN3633648.1 KpsF/GutQ family sugar-phosphate isomerase [Neolewinella lacunae]
MKNASLILQVATKTLEIEASALREMSASLGDAFVGSVNAIFSSQGRVVATGIGKTAIVAQKIVATFNSTGTPAIFLHAADAIHGDIGMVQPNDVVLCISKSGETAEIKMLALLTRQLGNPLIAMVGRPDSTLAQRAEHVLHTPVDREADPNDLAPTTSTTLQMAMGDALATALLALRGFSPQDFARYHPGGSLGKQLYLRVSDLHAHNQQPAVFPQTPLHETLLEMTAKCLGATAVLVPGTRQLAGIITDGDLRRMLARATDLQNVVAQDIMTATPKTVANDTLAIQALAMLRAHSITQLPVVDSAGQYLGFIHLHDLLREGLV